MNKATAMLTATTLMLGATSVYLLHALQAERTRHAPVTAAGPDASAVAEAPRQTTIAIATQDEDLSHFTTPVDPKARTSPVKVPARVKNRTHTAAQLAYFRLLMQKEYPDLAMAVGLQPEEAAAFFELLARQRAREAEDAMKRGSRTKADGGDWQKEQETDRAEQAAFLGEARATEWQKYLDSLGSRAEVRELRMQLADSDYPLRGNQYGSLVTLLAEEQRRHNGEREQLRRGQRDAANPTYQETIDYLDKRFTLIEESLARRGRAAASILDSEQLRRYQAMLDHERLRAQVEYDSFVTVNAEAARNSK